MAPRNFYAQRHVVATYRSGLEENISKQLAKAGVKAEYEQNKLAYFKPVTHHTYLADFVLPNGIIIESKGIFDVEDRKKHLLIQSQHPELDIRFVFSRSASKLYKGAKTTYADWCVKNGFKFADKLIPEAWLKEPKRVIPAGTFVDKTAKKEGKK